MTDLKLLHLHLPKTGGTALRRFFVDKLGQDSVSPPLQGIALREALLRWQHKSIISGHFLARQGDKVPDDRLIVTVLRDPVDRFLSEYFYNRFDIDELLVEAKCRALQLDAYIESLMSSSAQRPMVQIDMLYPLGTQDQHRLSSDEMLSCAIKTIDHSAFVGIQEEMDDFCGMLCAKFHWPPSSPDELNVTSRRLQVTDLTTKQRDNLESLLEPEIILYAHAKTRFKQDRRHFIAASDMEGERSNNSHDLDLTQQSASTQRSVEEDFGDHRCVIDDVQVIGHISGPGQSMTGEVMDVLFQVTSKESLDQVVAGIAIRDEMGSLAFGTNSSLLGEVYSLMPGKYIIRFTTLNRLGPGSYTIDAALTPTLSHYDGCFHWRHEVANLTVAAYATQHFEGNVLLDVGINVESNSEEATWSKRKPANEGIVARSFGSICRPLTSFHSTIDVMSLVDIVQQNSDLLLQVKIENRGTETWPSNGRFPVKLSYRWHSEVGTMIVADGIRSDLPGDVAPSATTLTCMHVRAPDKPGRFYLTPSLVQEHVAWFKDRDASNGQTLAITVV
jgi:hypothetical protein